MLFYEKNEKDGKKMKSLKDIPDNCFVSRDDSNSMIYVPVPMSLICAKEFRVLSDSAKLLYGVLFCWLNMSRNNNLSDGDPNGSKGTWQGCEWHASVYSGREGTGVWKGKEKMRMPIE